MMTSDAKRKLMWSLGFLKPDERKEIFDRIIELRNVFSSRPADFYNIGSLFEWVETEEGWNFWKELNDRQNEFTCGKTFCPHPTIIEIDDV